MIRALTGAFIFHEIILIICQPGIYRSYLAQSPCSNENYLIEEACWCLPHVSRHVAVCTLKSEEHKQQVNSAHSTLQHDDTMHVCLCNDCLQAGQRGRPCPVCRLPIRAVAYTKPGYELPPPPSKKPGLEAASPSPTKPDFEDVPKSKQV